MARAACGLEVSMLRMASAAFVLFAVAVISIGVLPSSSAEAGYYGARYGGYAYRGGYGYRAGYYGGYRSAYYGPRYYVRFYRPFATAPYAAPYYVNGCNNGYSDNGVYCYVFYGCPYSGLRY
jgi:hypothetical protein